MRLKLLLTAAILFMLSVTMPLWAAAPVRESASDVTVANVSNSGGTDSPRGIDSPRDLPKVSRNQQRPKPHVLCAECDEPLPIDDGSYTAGGCNCSRICYEGQTGCNLSVANNGCTAGTAPGQCRSCSVSGGCGW